jgi:putative transposase
MVKDDVFECRISGNSAQCARDRGRGYQSFKGGKKIKTLKERKKHVFDSFALSENKTYYTERIQLPYSEDLFRICHLSKNLYNFANFIYRQVYFYRTKENYTIKTEVAIYLEKFFKNRRTKFLNYPVMYSIAKNTEHHRKLPAQTSQQTLKLLDQNWNSYWSAKKRWDKLPREEREKIGKPKIPNFKKRDGEVIVVFTNQQLHNSIQIRHFDRTLRKNKQGKCTGEISFPKKAQLKPIKTTINIRKIQQIRILPRGSCYIMEVIYPHKKRDLGLNKNRAIAIDIGVNNLLTIVNNIGKKPVIIKGKVIKSINQFTNKKIAKIQSEKNKKDVWDQTLQEKRIWRKRNNKLFDYFHKSSRFVVDYCKKNDIGIIVIGYNKWWKQKAKLGKRNTQNFVYIPFLNLIKKIQYKADIIGINVILSNERYSSQDCCLCGRRWKANRKSRGVYHCDKCGKIINSDVNGAFNNGIIGLPRLFKRIPKLAKIITPIAVSV